MRSLCKAEPFESPGAFAALRTFRPVIKEGEGSSLGAAEQRSAQSTATLLHSSKPFTSVTPKLWVQALQWVATLFLVGHKTFWWETI